jgi:hypothetical protein
MVPLLLLTALIDALSPRPHRPMARLPVRTSRPEPRPRGHERARAACDDELGDPAAGLVSALTLSGVLWLIVLSFLF